MSVESDADRLIFLDPEAFGVEAVYTPRNGAPVTVIGNFDERPATFDPNRFMAGPEIAMQGAAKFSSSGITFECRRMDLPDGGKQRSKLTVNGVTYSVHDKQSDGTGMVVLVLMEDE